MQEGNLPSEGNAHRTSLRLVCLHVCGGMREGRGVPGCAGHRALLQGPSHLTPPASHAHSSRSLLRQGRLGGFPAVCPGRTGTLLCGSRGSRHWLGWALQMDISPNSVQLWLLNKHEVPGGQTPCGQLAWRGVGWGWLIHDPAIGMAPSCRW